MTSAGTAIEFPRRPVGTIRDGGPHTITPEAVAMYVDATNDVLERYTRPGLVPPVYAVVASSRAHTDLLLDLVPRQALLQSVHLGHAMEFVRPVTIGETVSSEAELIETRRSPFGFSLCMRVRVHDERGDLSSCSYHRVLFRGIREGVTAGSAPPGPRRSRGRARPLGTVDVHVASDQSLRYADASKDYLPIHTHVDVARRAGFEDLILHGMCTLAMCARAVVDVVADGDPTRLDTLGATFTRPVLVGRDLRVLLGIADGGTVRVDAQQDGQPVIRDGYATMRPGA